MNTILYYYYYTINYTKSLGKGAFVIVHLCVRDVIKIPNKKSLSV